MLEQIGIEAKTAAAEVAVLTTDKKNKILQSMADKLLKNTSKILGANKVDLDNSKDLELTAALVDRLTLSEERINGMASGLLKIIPLNDPVGSVTSSWTTDEGLDIKKIRSPFGVIGVIYEARPNVTSDVSGLCLKSGNAVILRGSSYCLDSNIAILETLQEALDENKCNKNIFQIIESKDRKDTLEFMNLTEYVDLIIPRGGKGLIQTLVENSKVPFILDGDGNVHLYVHSDAQKESIIDIILNSKIQRPGVCNALETLLINKEMYNEMGKQIIEALLANNVELFVDDVVKKDFSNLNSASEEHYAKEFLDLKLAVKIVDNVDEAVSHIKLFSSGHTEAILSQSDIVSEKFAKSIDSSVIFINSSTRFTDGEMFGFGSEIGISTQKLHVRGPMGLDALTNERYIVIGKGAVRE